MNKYRKKPIVIEAIQLQNNYNSIKNVLNLWDNMLVKVICLK